MNTRAIIKNSSLAILSGLLLSLCYHGMGNLGTFVWIWALPLYSVLFSLKNKTGRKGLALGYLCGVVFWLLNLKWLYAMQELDTVPLFGALLGWFAMTLYLATYFGVFGFIIAKWANPWKEPKAKKHKTRIDAKIAEKLKENSDTSKFAMSFKESASSLRFAFIHASLWTILEWVRSWMITGFSWNGLGAAFHGTPVFAQAAELFGVVGLSFFPMFACSVLFQVACRMIREAREGKMKPHWDLAVAGILVAFLFGFGISRMQQLNKAKVKEVNCLLVQQNTPMMMNWAQGAYVGTTLAYAEMTKEAIQKLEVINQKNWEQAQKKQNKETHYKIEKAELVLWPESVLIQGLLRFEKEKQWALVDVEETTVMETLFSGNHYLITGSNEFVFPDENNYTQEARKSYNSIALFKTHERAAARFHQTYRKNHLVMFGEYIPFRDKLPFLEKIIGGASGSSMGPNYLSGNSTEPLTIQHRGEPLQLIGSVCFEDTVGSLTRKFARPEPQLIVNVTNDGWFGQTEAARQHMANASFRCIELRRPMARAANTGISCVINVKGSIQNADGSSNAILDNKGGSFISDTLYAKAEVLVDSPMTLYALAGDWFIGVCGAIFVIGMIQTLRKRG